jgi:hypothetical protein
MEVFKTMADQGYELSWDGQIKNDGEFALLPEGDCNFEVITFERARHNGSEKLPPCPKAIVSIKVTNDKGESTVIKHNFNLHSSCEWALCEFFKAIGQRKHGEEYSMNWNKVPGAKGRCHVYVDKWTNDKGEVKESNKIKKFFDPSEYSTFQAGKF